MVDKPTPGPWEPFLLVDEAEIIAPDSKDVRVADVFCGYSFTGVGDYHLSVEECHANARLIAAAPDLLEACQAFVQAFEKSLQLEKTDIALTLAHAAIAKATGEP